MSALRQSIIAVALSAGLLLTPSCQSEDGTAQPLPPEKSSTSPSDSASSSASEPATPAWQDKYSQKQIAAYEEALRIFGTYEQRSEPIWRRGKVTPAAEELFQEYFYTWRTELNRLRVYEQSKVEVHGTPEILDARATRVQLARDSQSVTIRQCVDYSTVIGYQNGEETTPVTDRPQVRIITTSRAAGKLETPFKISQVQRFEGDRPCKP